MSRIIVGVDNGVSGGLAFIDMTGVPVVFNTPVFETFGYQKAAKTFHRFDHKQFRNIMFGFFPEGIQKFHFVIERPMVMPARFEATVSALRCYEATLVAIESHFPGSSFETIDSRVWQKAMLPTGIKGPELKKASMQRGIELFPGCADWILKQKDADPLMIMEFARRNR